MPRMWPAHPRPLPGEALSSWLRRLARGNVCSIGDLYAHSLKLEPVAETVIDFDPPQAILDALAVRTGVELDRLRGMTMKGWTPLMIDQLKGSADLFVTYVHQHSVLFEPSAAPADIPKSWLPWVNTHRFANPLGCPDCLAHGDWSYLRLHWRLAVVATCPQHRTWLQPVKPVGSEPAYECAREPRAQRPPDDLLHLDELTLQALEKGAVQLPQRRLHGGVWLRLLRTILAELSLSMLTAHKSEREVLRWVRLRAGGHLGGQLRGRVYESHTAAQQARMLRLAAAAVDLIQDGKLTTYGADAHLLRNRPLTQAAIRARQFSPTEDARWMEGQFEQALHMLASAQNDERLSAAI